MKSLIPAIFLPLLLVAAEDPKPKETPKPVEVTGASALRVIALHLRATMMQNELQAINAKLKAAVTAACEEKKLPADCKVIGVGEESLTLSEK